MPGAGWNIQHLAFFLLLWDLGMFRHSSIESARNLLQEARPLGEVFEGAGLKSAGCAGADPAAAVCRGRPRQAAAHVPGRLLGGKSSPTTSILLRACSALLQNRVYAMTLCWGAPGG